MCNRYFLLLAFGFFLPGICLSQEESSDDTFLKSGHWVPVDPPPALYTIDCRFAPASGKIEGTATIRFRNGTSLPIRRLALDWALSSEQTLELSVNGKPVAILADSGETSLPSPLLYELPQPLPPDKEIVLNAKFSKIFQSADKNRITVTAWHPRLWWGFSTHDKFAVKIQAPADYVVAASGRLDEQSGYYHAEKVRSFGIFLGKDHQVIEANAGDILVRCVFIPQGEKCARLLLTTAVDAINFYRKRFGLYPYASLTIVPGMPYPAGGYPVATAMVAIHGQERFADKPQIHWQWITAHEIGHQYWGEYVMEKDSPGWLWIGMGIYTDREYIRARSLSLEKHRELMARYTDGVREHLNTTAALTPEQYGEVEFDFNNVVIHGKGFSIISALAAVFGKETFDRIYQRCLREFAGRRLGAHEFQTVCEQESRQNLEWFFEQWVRSNRYLAYQITSQKCVKQNDRYLSHVKVACLGTLKMPVPVVASFQDGTEQRACTDRLLDANVLLFESQSPLKEARLDPDNELAMVIPPPTLTLDDLQKGIKSLPWTGAGKKAIELFDKTPALNPTDQGIWLKLGLTLFDGRYYPQALDAFRRFSQLTAAEKDSVGEFVSLVWQGHLLDLLDRRDEAIQSYQDALKKDTGQTMRHDQYGMAVNRQWVEERLKTPYQRR